MSALSKVFCAIDTSDLDHACLLARQIAPVTGGIKIGLEFFNAFGLGGVERLVQAAPDAQLFLDLKFHDIPNTVSGAVRSVCSNFSPAYLNVHAAGGRAMMEAAKASCGDNTRLLAVTVLTSLDEISIAEIGYQSGLAERVEQLALLSRASGLDGVVCSAFEIERLRAACGDDFVLMVPGIRPKGAVQGDQKRVMTPEDAMEAGATHLVIGRPITGAEDPAKAAADILSRL
ncbi:MAG: orotidine-5'-phosphate decarboxylase [Alphaproteobacteria bacterium]